MVHKGKNLREKINNALKAIVSQAIEYDVTGIKGSLEPSISIGKTNIIKDSEIKIKDLIASADENIYNDKKSV